MTRSREMNQQLYRAQTAFRSGASLLEAKVRVDRVLTNLPDDVEALKLRSSILLSMDRPEEALVDARRAAGLVDGDGETHVLVCEAGVRADRKDVALTSLNRGADLLLDSATLYVRLSQCALELGQTTRAESLARVAVARSDRDARGRLQLARVFMQSGSEDMAVSVLLQGLSNRSLRATDIRRDAVLAPLMDRPGLAPYRLR